MIMYKVTNITTMNVTVEDLGLNLQPGESTLIATDAYEKSSDLAEHKNWFKIEPVVIPKKGPPTPVKLFKPSSPTHIPDKGVDVTHRTPSTPGVSLQDFERFADSLKEEIGKNDERLRSELSELMEMVKGVVTSAPALAPSSVGPPVPSAPAEPSEVSPVVLSGNIIPVDGEVTARVKTREDDVVVSDFDETRKALRKRRTKKSTKK